MSCRNEEPAAGTLLTSVLLIGSLTESSLAGGSEQLRTIDHYVGARSTVPAVAGQVVQFYLRERETLGWQADAATTLD